MDSVFSKEDITRIKSRNDLLAHLRKKKIDLKKVERILSYEWELELLQVELLKLQNWILKEKKRVIVIFEGRDAAGKGGTIRRFTWNRKDKLVCEW